MSFGSRRKPHSEQYLCRSYFQSSGRKTSTPGNTSGCLSDIKLKRRIDIEIEITQTEKYGTVKNTLTVPQCFINLYDLIRNSYFKNSNRFVCSFPMPVLPYFLLLLQHSISLWQQNKYSERCYSTHCIVASQKCYRPVKHS